MTARRIVIACLLAFLAICLYAAGAKAHDLWRNGEPIPAWVKASCCGPADAHNIPESDVVVTRAGYLVAGRTEPIPFDKASPSPDGTHWIFYTGDINKATIFCFFVPVKGV